MTSGRNAFRVGLGLLFGIVSGQVSAAPELLFHSSFDGTANAVVAKGTAQPVAARGLAFAEGLTGQAVRLTADAKARLEYALDKNVNPLRGTISLWYKPEWKPGTEQSWRHLFGFTSPWDKTRVGSGAIFLWHFGSKLRGDTSDKEDNHIAMNLPAESGVWRHIAFTWDEEHASIMVDGKNTKLKRDSDNPFKAALQAAATAQNKSRRVYDRPRAFTSFHVGCTREGQQADGLIDDLKIFSAPLSTEELQALAAEHKGLSVATRNTYFLNGSTNTLHAVIANQADSALSVTWHLQSPDGATLQKSDSPVEVAKARPVELALALPRGPKGRYTLKVEGPSSLPASTDVWILENANADTAESGQLTLQLVETLMLDKEPPADRFATTGGHTFGTLGGVRFLQAGTNRNDRFAIRMRLPEPAPLYCFEWDYPDDKLRTADIIVQPSAGTKNNYELQTGYFTGDEYRNQNKMLTSRCLYWAPTQDVSVVFMTAREDAPAAVAQIRLYKVTGGLPEAKVRTPAPVDGWHRTIGLYYEDPAIGYDFAASGSAMPDFETLIDRTAAYMKYCGQNLFAYPGVWYHGLIGPNYNPRLHAPNFLEAWLVKFDAEGLGVMPTFNEQTLTLPDGLTITRDSLSDGSLHNTCVSLWSTGMPNPGGWHGTPPNFNLLHPYTQQVVLEEFDELVAQGVGHPSFKGIDLRLAEHCFHWLGSIRAGYNDYMIDAFTQETGIKVPVDRTDPLRGKLYAKWLLANARDAWVDWRCRAVARWHKRLAARLAQARPDLRLSLTLLTPMHPTRGEPFEKPDYITQLNKEAGIDAALYADSPNIIIAQGLRPARFRAGYDRPKSAEESTFVREVFSTRAYYESLQAANLPWVHLHDHYWESPVGNPDRRSKTDKALTAPWFKEETWRVSTLNPASFHAMRPYVLPLRYQDVLGFTRGGFLIGTYGMENYLTPFAQAFRALPATRFEDRPGSTGTVKLRALTREGKTWFYVVNTGEGPAEFTVTAEAAEIVDLVTGLPAIERKGKHLELLLQPYQLRSFCAAGSVPVKGK